MNITEVVKSTSINYNGGTAFLESFEILAISHIAKYWVDSYWHMFRVIGFTSNNLDDAMCNISSIFRVSRSTANVLIQLSYSDTENGFWITESKRYILNIQDREVEIEYNDLEMWKALIDNKESVYKMLNAQDKIQSIKLLRKLFNLDILYAKLYVMEYNDSLNQN